MCNETINIVLGYIGRIFFGALGFALKKVCRNIKAKEKGREFTPTILIEVS